MNDLIPIEQLPKGAEYIMTTNVEQPIKILGVAKMKIRNSKNDDWREGFVVLCEDCGCKKKAEVNEDLYNALHLVFSTLADDNGGYLVD